MGKESFLLEFEKFLNKSISCCEEAIKIGEIEKGSEREKIVEDLKKSLVEMLDRNIEEQKQAAKEFEEQLKDRLGFPDNLLEFVGKIRNEALETERNRSVEAIQKLK